jgi:hypothetical protein
MTAYCVDLAAPLAPHETGQKFARLGFVCDRCRVPPAVCVTARACRDSLPAEVARFLRGFFEEVRGTLGSSLIARMPELERQVATWTMAPEVREALVEALGRVFGPLGGRRFAVRSSGIDEDGGTHSFAGVYSSFLDREGLDEVCAAVVDCWKLYYEYRAIVSRLRAGLDDSEPALGVIVQAMIHPERAGVAFSDRGGGGTVAIEYVPGLGDRLVSGAATPIRFHGRPADAAGTNLEAVARTALALADACGHDVDMEWAWDRHGLHIVQVRPVTARPHFPARAPARPFQIAPLYTEPAGCEAIPLGVCEPIYRYYTNKRTEAYRLAAALEVPTGAAHLMGFTGEGLRENRTLLEATLGSSSAREVVVDLRPNLRQIILPKAGLYPFLAATFGETGNDHQAIIVRDYHRGEMGFISCLVGGGREVYVEYAPEGLLAMNRGTASARGFRVGVEPPHETIGDDPPVEPLRAALPQVVRLTRALADRCGASQLEWVLVEGWPYFVDFSRERNGVNAETWNGAVRIAGGEARGPAFFLERDSTLDALSIGPAVSVSAETAVMEHRYIRDLTHRLAGFSQKPIVVTDRPLAILSVLFDKVAGFVFREGSLLCHLAILLREQEIPSLICPGMDAPEEVMLTLLGSCVVVGPLGESAP